jgi:hypothetical protein
MKTEDKTLMSGSVKLSKIYPYYLAMSYRNHAIIIAVTCHHLHYMCNQLDICKRTIWWKPKNISARFLCYYNAKSIYGFAEDWISTCTNAPKIGTVDR